MLQWPQGCLNIDWITVDRRVRCDVGRVPVLSSQNCEARQVKAPYNVSCKLSHEGVIREMQRVEGLRKGRCGAGQDRGAR